MGGKANSPTDPLGAQAQAHSCRAAGGARLPDQQINQHFRDWRPFAIQTANSTPQSDDSVRCL